MLHGTSRTLYKEYNFCYFMNPSSKLQVKCKIELMSSPHILISLIKRKSNLLFEMSYYFIIHFISHKQPKTAFSYNSA